MGKDDEAPSSSMDLDAFVQAHSEFFDKLVNLVPPKFYLPVDDTVERPWFGALSNRQKKEAKKKTRENLKKARRERLDPKSFATTTELQQQRREAEAPEEEEPEESKADEGPRTHQDLRERLRKRIEAIRAARNADAADAKAKIAREWRKNVKAASKKASKKRKRAAQKEAATGGDEEQEENTPNKRRKIGGAETEMEFGRVKIDSQNRPQKRKSKEKLLQQATKLQEEMQDSEKGKMVAEKHSWDAAVSRAAGEKVFDNPKLLKQSLKKDQQRKEKSTQKWQERQDSEKQRSKERQQNRSSNIKQRITQRKERAIAKREKKLLRPGFEGRKAGFINDVE